MTNAAAVRPLTEPKAPWTAAACCRFLKPALLALGWMWVDREVIMAGLWPQQQGCLRKAAAGCRSPVCCARVLRRLLFLYAEETAGTIDGESVGVDRAREIGVQHCPVHEVFRCPDAIGGNSIRDP
jgi:hypothetical protein